MNSIKNRIKKLSRDSLSHKLYKSEVQYKNLYLEQNNLLLELKSIKERYEYAINGSNDGVWDWNLETNEIYFSPIWKKMLGYEDAELENALSTWESRVHPDDLAQAVKDFTANMHGETTYYENIHRLRHKDGHWVWILDRGKTIFDASSKAIRMVGFHTDISYIKKLEQDIIEKDEIMIAQSRYAAMGEMISMIAHQWRQPLSVIAMDANNILADIELESLEINTLQGNLQSILFETHELSKTIDDFRNFFKPDRAKNEVLVPDTFMKSLHIIGKSLENSSIKVENILNSSTKISIFERELEQVFINILNNAKDALQESNRENKKITNTIYETDKSIIIEICDNGCGFQVDTIEKIFEPYFSTKDEKNGTGLGLYICKVIVEKHLKGKLFAKNSSNGAIITIELPKVSA